MRLTGVLVMGAGLCLWVGREGVANLRAVARDQWQVASFILELNHGIPFPILPQAVSPLRRTPKPSSRA
jgi:hypothetical protein